VDDLKAKAEAAMKAAWEETPIGLAHRLRLAWERGDFEGAYDALEAIGGPAAFRALRAVAAWRLGPKPVGNLLADAFLAIDVIAKSVPPDVADRIRMTVEAADAYLLLDQIIDLADSAHDDEEPAREAEALAAAEAIVRWRRAQIAALGTG